MKRILSLMLVLAMLLALPLSANAEENQCGENLFWSFANNTLTIEGSGEMDNYDWNLEIPWFSTRFAMRKIVVQDGAATIGDFAFYDCERVTEVQLPESITTIGQWAFSVCNALTEIDIPNGVTMIDENAFSYCNKLEKVTLPETLQHIRSGAFWTCPSLKEIVIPESVIRIGKWAFADCENLTDITILNPNCAIINDPTTLGSKNTTTIHCAKGSTAEAYATKFKYNVVLFEPEDPDDPDEPDEPHVCPSEKYTDAPKLGNWAHEGIDFAIEHGLFAGLSDTTFGPKVQMNRAMLVTVLWRYVGAPKGYENTFADVNAKSGSWYIDAVAWAAANKIVSGMSETVFNPTGLVTREQMASILFRFTAYLELDNSNRADFTAFPDAAKVSTWAADAMQWAIAENLISGNKVGEIAYIQPKEGATREQVASILMRYILNIVE